MTKFQRKTRNFNKTISPSRRKRNLKRLRERIAKANKAIAMRRARLQKNNNERINENKSQIIPIISLIDDSDSEVDFETNCTEVSFDEEDDVEDITDCRILGDNEERALRRKSMRALEDARIDKQARAQAQDNRDYDNLRRTIECQQREDGRILLLNPPKEWEERERDWKDGWTFSPHVISANELLRIAHAGRAAERQRVVNAQASFRQFQRDWRNRSIPRAA